MLTLYSPVHGWVATHHEIDGLTIVAGIGRQSVKAPTRGVVTSVAPGCVTITDLRDRVVEVRAEASAGSLTLLVAEGDSIGFDQTLFTWDGTGSLTVDVRSPGASDLLAHCEPGAEVAAGADLFSVGPFACGA